MNDIPVYLVVPLTAWILAQLIKLGVASITGNKEDVAAGFFRSGKMPSGHAAGLAALLTVLGVLEGIGSPLFGVTAIMASIVLYDAIHVRRAVGEQGRILRMLAKDKAFYSAEGHRIIEVMAGLLLGVLVAVAMLQIL
jgi:uncharacterized protein